MSEEYSLRKPGGVSRSIDYFARCLRNEPGDDDLPKQAALHEVARLLRIAHDEAQRGDESCGFFLGEVATFFAKKRRELGRQNAAFREVIDTWKPIRVASAKNSALRTRIYQIITDAKMRKRRYAIAKMIPGAAELLADDAHLSNLPEFSGRDRVVDAWTDQLVYPTLRQHRDELESDPKIRAMAKAHDSNTKLQLSRVKPLIRATVARIAKLPKAYYFDTA